MHVFLCEQLCYSEQLLYSHKKPRPADNLRKYKKKQIPKNKVILKFKI
jgi:hypothetical protein